MGCTGPSVRQSGKGEQLDRVLGTVDWNRAQCKSPDDGRDGAVEPACVDGPAARSVHHLPPVRRIGLGGGRPRTALEARQKLGCGNPHPVEVIGPERERIPVVEHQHDPLEGGIEHDV